MLMFFYNGDFIYQNEEKAHKLMAYKLDIPIE